jgi:hypothetical protein
LKSPNAVLAGAAAATHRVAFHFKPEAHAPGGGRISSPDFFAISIPRGLSAVMPSTRFWPYFDGFCQKIVFWPFLW